MSVALLALLGAASAAEPATATLDVAVFSQADEGGNPYQTEAFTYTDTSLAVRGPVSERVSLRARASLGTILNQSVGTLPDTSDKVLTTQASPDTVLLDATAGATVKLGAWTLDVGAFYHHQWAFISLGPDLTVSRELADGNTTVRVGWSGRGASLEIDPTWDGRDLGRTERWSSTLGLSVSQILSPKLFVLVGGQLVNQLGFLGHRLNFVILEETADRDADDERLPDARHRGQLNVRLRYAPWAGAMVGLDSSGYLDTWGVRQVVLQPVMEWPIGPVRINLAHRFSMQWGSRYFRTNQAIPHQFQTQDSDLATFHMHSPSILTRIALPSSGRVAWTARVGVMGFWRTDGLWAIGGTAGAGASW